MKMNAMITRIMSPQTNIVSFQFSLNVRSLHWLNDKLSTVRLELDTTRRYAELTIQSRNSLSSFALKRLLKSVENCRFSISLSYSVRRENAQASFTWLRALEVNEKRWENFLTRIWMLEN
jgi:hypothetical protein